MSHEVLKGKLVFGKDNDLIIFHNKYKFSELNKNFIIFDNFLKLSLNGEDFSAYKKIVGRYFIIDDNEKEFLLYSLNKKFKSIIDLSNNPTYCRDVDTYITDLGNLNLIDSKYFRQLTLDNSNENIINFYSDLNISVLESDKEYKNYSKNINLVSKILEDNLDIKTSKCCIYESKNNSEIKYFGFVNDKTNELIFVESSFLSNLTEEYIKELELHFNSNKKVFNITPSLDSEDNKEFFIKLQKQLMINNILKELERVSDDAIHLSLKPLYDLTKLGKIVLSATSPMELIIDIGSECLKTIAVDKFSKNFEKLTGIDGNLVPNIESLISDGPKDYLEGKLASVPVRLDSKDKEKEEQKNERTKAKDKDDFEV